MTTAKTIAELRELLARATPGPLIVGRAIADHGSVVRAPLPASREGDGAWIARMGVNVSEWEANRDLYIAAVNALPALLDHIAALETRVVELEGERDRPEVTDFIRGVRLEAEHQRARWGSDHDAGKTPFDWFWLVGYLAQKAADAAVRGDAEKAKHHTISTAAALANWHLALSGADNRMRPGIDAAALTKGPNQ